MDSISSIILLVVTACTLCVEVGNNGHTKTFHLHTDYIHRICLNISSVLLAVGRWVLQRCSTVSIYHISAFIDLADRCAMIARLLGCISHGIPHINNGKGSSTMRASGHQVPLIISRATEYIYYIYSSTTVYHIINWAWCVRALFNASTTHQRGQRVWRVSQWEPACPDDWYYVLEYIPIIIVGRQINENIYYHNTAIYD